jgi:hypothetical protein
MPQMMTASKAKFLLRAKSGTLAGAYYAAGVEVPPRRGATFSMRYTTTPGVQNCRSAFAFLRRRMAGKRVGMIGEVILASGDGRHTVSLGGYIRRPGGVLDPVPGDVNRRPLTHAQFAAHLKTRKAA